MQTVVLDTDVLSFLAKGDIRGSLYSHHLIGVQRCICFQTVAELRLWMVVKNSFDSNMADHWAQITAHRRSLGKPIDCGDAWIAASALRHDATLLTHNRTHYETIPTLKLISYG